VESDIELFSPWPSLHHNNIQTKTYDREEKLALLMGVQGPTGLQRIKISRAGCDYLCTAHGEVDPLRKKRTRPRQNKRKRYIIVSHIQRGTRPAVGS